MVNAWTWNHTTSQSAPSLYQSHTVAASGLLTQQMTRLTLQMLLGLPVGLRLTLQTLPGWQGCDIRKVAMVATAYRGLILQTLWAWWQLTWCNICCQGAEGMTSVIKAARLITVHRGLTVPLRLGEKFTAVWHFNIARVATVAMGQMLPGQQNAQKSDTIYGITVARVTTAHRDLTLQMLLGWQQLTGVWHHNCTNVASLKKCHRGLTLQKSLG